MFQFSKASWEKLIGVHEDLLNVMVHAIASSPIDFKIVQGVRTQAYQDDLYAQGRTKPGNIVTWTRKSRHITGHAVDVAAWVNGKINWDEKYYSKIADVVLESAENLSVPVKWGVISKDGVRRDFGHYELDPKVYP